MIIKVFSTPTWPKIIITSASKSVQFMSYATVKISCLCPKSTSRAKFSLILSVYGYQQVCWTIIMIPSSSKTGRILMTNICLIFAHLHFTQWSCWCWYWACLPFISQYATKIDCIFTVKESWNKRINIYKNDMNKGVIYFCLIKFTFSSKIMWKWMSNQK